MALRQQIERGDGTSGASGRRFLAVPQATNRCRLGKNKRFMKGTEANATSSMTLPAAEGLALGEEAFRILGVDLTTIP